MTDSQTNKDIIPYGYGTWVYDKIFRDKDDTSPLADGTLEIKPGNFVKPGLFKDAITAWNQKATAFPYTQVYSYGGDIEMYCRGSGESAKTDPCIKANGFKSDKGLEDGFVVTFPGDDKDKHIGLKSLEGYLNIPKVAQNILIIDGRMDNKIGDEDDYLDYFNTLEKDEAEAFADKVSKNICGNNSVDGVQFDIEPFSFTGEGGSVSGSGQQYFYNQIAKNFAGWNGNANDNTGVNPNLTNDPFGCVNANHPNGRFFSIFTFAKAITPDVKTMLTQYGNGCVMDSLYDLGPLPGGQLNSVDNFKKYAAQEIKDMQALNVPYQFAIPAAASAHEFETKTGQAAAGEGNQIQYIKAVMELIDIKVLKVQDPNFKGIGVWSWNQKMYWHGDEYTPASPSDETMSYLDSAVTSAIVHEEL
jgi:hypothetical protein